LLATNGKSTEVDAKYVITDTRMQVFFHKLKSEGGSVKVKIDFSYISQWKVQTVLEF
jgi:hypothetical protein